MIVKVFSGHSISNMSNASSYALQDFDKYSEAHDTYEVEHISTAVHVEPAEENYNYWYVMTVAFINLDPAGHERGD